jgi:GT2 family glycosyltransferase
VAFTDVDCVADRNWIAALLARFDGEPGLGGVGGYLPSLELKSPLQYYVAERDLLSQEVALEDRPLKQPFVITANALLPRRLIEEVGGFDPACVISGEDADLCWRIADNGYRFVFAPDAVVHHRHRATVGALCRWMFRYGMGSVYLLKKHRRRYGIGPAFVHLGHYKRWLIEAAHFIRPAQRYDKWERRFAGYDVLRFACFTAGRMVGSIRYGAIML